MQYKALCDNVPSGHAVVTMDFSENYKCERQDQPQSAYYSYEQVTIHPTVMRYRCPNCGTLVTDNIVYLSDVLKHDAHFVNHVTDHALKHLNQLGRISNITIFSDGCAGQYKAKVPFFYLTKMASNPAKLQRCYFGSRHGKSQCDPLGGVVKMAALRAVRGRRVTIQNAAEFFQFCTEKLTLPLSQPEGCCHTKRSFVLVKEEDIDRKVAAQDLETLRGTRMLHCLRPLDDGILACRNFACFCEACQKKAYSDCKNKEHVEPWKIVSLLKKTANPLATEDDPSPLQDYQYQTASPDNSHCPGEEGTYHTDHNQQPSSSAQIKHRMKTFRELHRLLTDCSTFAQLENVARNALHIVEQFPLPVTNRLVTDQPVMVDTTARSLLPSDAPPRHFPVCVLGDGNCFPRTLSMLLFGKEDSHLEIRCRIVMEHALNEELFQNAAIWGLSEEQLQMLASLSDQYCGDIKGTYRQEVMSIVRPATDMGLWQLMAASQMMKRPLQSVYPELGYPALRDMHNRCFVPPGIQDTASAVAIMWSTVNRDHGEESPAHFTANHFVPLFPLPEANLNETYSAAYGCEKDACNIDVPHEGCFYTVLWRDGIYIAQIEEVNEEMEIASVNFMEEHEGRFFWPPKPDRSEELFSAVLTRVKEMELDEARSTQRRQLFKPVFD